MHGRRMPRSWPTLTKGHGTGNDFLLLSDPDGELAFEAVEIAAVADRRFGIGADGVIRAVRTAALRALDPAVDGLVPRETGDEPDLLPEWFMDYRNADGSVAEMCGNGLRVFVRYLLASGLATLGAGELLLVGTRAGVLEVCLAHPGQMWGPPGPGSGESEPELSVAMGRYGIPGGAVALERGSDAVVEVSGLPAARPGLSITMPNPHVVIAVASEAELAGIDLTRAPVVTPAPADGTNVEIVEVLGEHDDAAGPVGVLRMRVHERGVGETLSCGTGACAAAVAARAWAGPGGPDRWVVHVPGGTVRVAIDVDGEVELTGPAELVATVTLGT